MGLSWAVLASLSPPSFFRPPFSYTELLVILSWTCTPFFHLLPSPSRSAGPLRRTTPQDRSTGPLRRTAPQDRSAGPLRRTAPQDRSAGPLIRPAPQDHSAGPLRPDHFTAVLIMVNQSATDYPPALKPILTMTRTMISVASIGAVWGITNSLGAVLGVLELSRIPVRSKLNLKYTTTRNTSTTPGLFLCLGFAFLSSWPLASAP